MLLRVSIRPRLGDRSGPGVASRAARLTGHGSTSVARDGHATRLRPEIVAGRPVVVRSRSRRGESPFERAGAGAGRGRGSRPGASVSRNTRPRPAIRLHPHRSRPANRRLVSAASYPPPRIGRQVSAARYRPPRCLVASAPHEAWFRGPSKRPFKFAHHLPPPCRSLGGARHDAASSLRTDERDPPNVTPGGTDFSATASDLATHVRASMHVRAREPPPLRAAAPLSLPRRSPRHVRRLRPPRPAASPDTPTSHAHRTDPPHRPPSHPECRPLVAYALPTTRRARRRHSGVNGVPPCRVPQPLGPDSTISKPAAEPASPHPSPVVASPLVEPSDTGRCAAHLGRREESR